MNYAAAEERENRTKNRAHDLALLLMEHELKTNPSSTPSSKDFALDYNSRFQMIIDVLKNPEKYSD